MSPISMLVAALMGVLYLTRADPQCSTRTSSVKFGVNSYTNKTKHRLVQVRLVRHGQESESVELLLEHSTSLCAGVETVALDVDVAVPTVTDTLPAPSSTPTSKIPTTTSATVLKCKPEYELLPGVGCYKDVKTRLSWEDARQSCVTDGGQLAVPGSQEEWQFFLKIRSRETGYSPWLGIKKSGDQWLTVEGVPLSKLEFNVGWDSNASKKKDCVIVWLNGFDDYNCTTTNTRSICKQSPP